MPLPPNIDNLTLVTLDKITRIKDKWIVKDPIVIARLNSIGSTHTFKIFLTRSGVIEILQLKSLSRHVFTSLRKQFLITQLFLLVKKRINQF